MSDAKKLTPAQGLALKLCLLGEVRYIHELDSRVRRALQGRGLLIWDQGKYFGRIDRDATADAVYRGGCEWCEDCQEILLDPPAIKRGAYCPRAQIPIAT